MEKPPISSGATERSFGHATQKKCGGEGKIPIVLASGCRLSSSDDLEGLQVRTKIHECYHQPCESTQTWAR